MQVKLTGHFELNQEKPGLCRLSDAMPNLREKLQTPLERLKQPPNLEKLASLRHMITSAKDNTAVIDLAHVLPGSELGWLFFLLTDIDDNHKPDQQLISRVSLIIRERACPSLYQHAWLIFQKYYDQPPVGKNLDLLCTILEIRQQSGLDPSFPLISEIISPASRPFMKKLMRRLAEQEMPVQTFIDTYAVSSDLPLGSVLVSSTFLSGSESLYSQSQRLFAQTLKSAHIDIQLKLLKHFFQMKKLSPTSWNAYCQIIYRKFGPPDQGHVIWESLSDKHVRKFQNWVIAATIGSHCRDNPDKARVFLHYAEHIQSIESWDNETMLINFPGFVIVDNRLDPETAIYYDQQQAERRLVMDNQQTEPPHPASTVIARRRVDEAIRRASCSGIVGLPFDHEGIRYTRIFLNFCIQEQVLRQRNLIARLKNKLKA